MGRSRDEDDDDNNNNEGGPLSLSLSSSPPSPSSSSPPSRTISSSISDLNDENSAPNDPNPARDDDGGPSNVQVAVRIRPLLAQEADSDICINVFPGNNNHNSNNKKNKSCTTKGLQIGSSQGPRFTFDHVWEPTTSQQDIFEHLVEPLVESCWQGYNATLLAYGQTGSGKTFTVLGESTSASSAAAGVIPRALVRIFDKLAKQQQQQQRQEEESSSPESDSSGSTTTTTTVRLQFLEVYGDEIRDLLATTPTNNKLMIREGDADADDPQVVGATQRTVQDAEQALTLVTHGMLRRVTGATAMNEASSRSHAILSVWIEQQQEQSIVVATNDDDDEGDDDDDNDDNDNEEPRRQRHVQVKRSKFNFVDLAGSERQKRTQSEGKRLKEGIDINKGLLVLGNVISALGDPKKHGKTFVPYRDSKLTRLLKGSLGGNHKTLMIACVSPSSDNLDESLNCLRYANRAKNIQNNAVVNVDPNSRLVSELQGQVQTLARELLLAWDGDTSSSGRKLTRETVQALAAGGASSSTTSPIKISAPVTSASTTALETTTARGNSETEERLRKVEMELARTRDRLRESQANHDSAEEQLYVAKAEKELFQLQLSVQGGSTVPASDASHAAFLEKAKEYEAEIGKLKFALRTAETKANRLKWMQGDEGDGEVSIEKAKKALEKDRECLAKIQSTISSTDGSDSEPVNRADGKDLAKSHSEIEDEKEKEEEAQLNLLTEKYLAESHEEDEGNGSAEANGDTGLTHSPGRRKRRLQADLVELSRSIAAKEDLIDQLQVSQEKYASMRDFYEEKLKEMGEVLNEKEAEREQLMHELKNSQKGNKPNKELETRLREKERHIASLKKKQKELSDLTAVSTRNHSELSRLQNEVRMMKRKKVDLQKQIGEERKQHAAEKKQLQKNAIQKERELNKWKKVSGQREVQAQKASQVAKARLDELGHLRAKYKDAEKKIRVLSVKRGVMAKAGLDPVIVGRRESSRSHDMNMRPRTRSASQKIDADSLRDHFDQKVAEVVTKESLADKLAHEWEEHFELSTKLQELLESQSEVSEDAVQSLSVQIQFKEDRIHQLAQRLGKRQQASHGSEGVDSSAKSDSFLFDDKFTKISSGSPSALSKGAAARVLFGMVVRERRRVAALARTASSLDERAQAAEKAAEANEDALRSYMNEQRREFEAIDHTQQEKILSLMNLVKDSSNEGQAGPGMEAVDASTSLENDGSKLLVLANERISLLERQVDKLRSETQTIDSYRTKVDELNDAVTSKSRDYDDAQEELSELRSMLRQIRDIVASHGRGEETDSVNDEILEVIKDALHPSRPTATKQKRRSSRSGFARNSRRYISPRLKKHVQLMHTSDSGDDAVTSEWATDIMQDLALIAEGKMPPSLAGSSAVVMENGESHEDPMPSKAPNDSSQGVPRRKVEISSPSPGKEERRALSRRVANRLEKIVIPGVESKDSAHGVVGPEDLITPPAGTEFVPAGTATSDKDYKTVFERLVSPSHYTGTQKEKFQKQTTRKARTSNDPAARLLDDLLQSDNEAGCENRGTASRTYNDYTQQDVFERLQRTTTQAYAVKHHGTIEGNTHDDKCTLSPTLSSRSFQKENGPAEGGAVSEAVGAPMSDYTSQDVFERLQKTTTEAYAKKANPKHDN